MSHLLPFNHSVWTAQSSTNCTNIFVSPPVYPSKLAAAAESLSSLSQEAPPGQELQNSTLSCPAPPPPRIGCQRIRALNQHLTPPHWTPRSKASHTRVQDPFWQQGSTFHRPTVKCHQWQIKHTCASKEPIRGLNETDFSTKEMPHPSPAHKKHLLLLSSSCLQILTKHAGSYSLFRLQSKYKRTASAIKKYAPGLHIPKMRGRMVKRNFCPCPW